LPCGDARQSKFSYLYLLHKNYQTRLKNSRKLEQTKSCCLLLIENKFEVKTQFECQITYKSNHMLLTLWNSNGDVSNWSIVCDKMFKIRSNFSTSFTNDGMRYWQISLFSKFIHTL
jgi:hypothetical protein